MGSVIAFVPASGGVGASTLAAAVAVRSAAVGRSCVAVDLDGYAGTLDVAFGVEDSVGWRWPDLSEVDGVVDGEALAAQLPMSCGVAVLGGHAPKGWGPTAGGLSGAREAEVSAHGSGEGPGELSPVVHGAVSGDAPDAPDWVASVGDVVLGVSLVHDLTVLDLSRDVAVLAAVAHLVDAVVVVAGPSLGQLTAAGHAVTGVRRAVGAARRAGDSWSLDPPLPIEPWLVLRGRRVEPELADLVMDGLDVPLVAVIPDDRLMLADLSEGRPPGARARGSVVRAADTVLLRLARQEQAA